MGRRNLYLVMLLVAQLAIALYVFRPGLGNGQRSNSPLLPGLDENSVTSLVILDGEGKRIDIVKDGARWVIPSMMGKPADAAKVFSLLGRLRGLTAGTVVAETPSSHRRLKVADDAYERMIEVIGPAGGPLRIYLGTSPANQSVHIRLGSRPAVFLTRGISTWEVTTDPMDWAQRETLPPPSPLPQPAPGKP